MKKLAHAVLTPPQLNSSLDRFSEAGALSRLLSAALIDGDFCNRLLQDPLRLISEGYNGESFLLGEKELKIINKIRAKTLSEFAAQLLLGLNQP